jgi:hypothetical protein
MEEVHYGGEGPYWAVVPIKKNERRDINFPFSWSLTVL